MDSKGWQVTCPLNRRPCAALPFIQLWGRMHLCRLAAITVSTACTISATCEECKGAQEPPRSDAVVRDGSAGPRRCLSREVSSPTRHRLLCRGVPTPAGRLPFLYLVLNPRCRPTWGSLLRWVPCPHPTLLRNTRPGPPARAVLLKEGVTTPGIRD